MNYICNILQKIIKFLIENFPTATREERIDLYNKTVEILSVHGFIENQDKKQRFHILIQCAKRLNIYSANIPNLYFFILYNTKKKAGFIYGGEFYTRSFITLPPTEEELGTIYL